MNSKARLVYEFGPFQLEPAEYRLLRDGQPVLLTPKAFRTLVVLTEHAGRVVEKNELMKLVWFETVVEESSITQNIFTLRKVLGANADGVPYIETVPKRGYRLAVPVREVYEEAVTQDTAGTIAAALPDLEPALDTLTLQGRSRRPSTVRRRFLVAAAGLAALIAVALGGNRFLRRSPPDTVPAESIAITRLTNTGNSLGAVISADRRFIAYTLTNVRRGARNATHPITRTGS